ncbi:MAG: alpha/beta fold hydrolase [Steroidobacteraceae bacterium]|jgi:predicted alpha/beta-fold hydrolase
MHYRLFGELRDSRPVVVLVHGWACDETYWDAQLGPLQREYPLVTLDLAGHGRSPANRDDWTMRAYGHDVATIVRALPTRAPVVLVGHSMGGPVTVEAALELGDRVRAVIGVDTFKNVGLPPTPAAEIELRLTAFAADFEATTRLFVTRTFFTPAADVAMMTRIATAMASGNPSVGIASIRALNDWDGRAAMSRLDTPVVAINADFGMPTDEARIKEFAPHFRLIPFQGAGHFLMMEQPERFNALLLRELATLEASFNRQP